MFIGLIIIMAVVFLFDHFKNRKSTEETIDYLMNRDFEILKTVENSGLNDDPLFIKLNTAVHKKNPSKVAQYACELEKKDLGKEEKLVLYELLFKYYASAKDEEATKTYYQKLSEVAGEKEMKHISMIYDTKILRGSAFLDDINKEIARTKGKEKASLESLAAQMYQNKGIKYKAKQYKQLSEKHYREATYGKAGPREKK